jgi:hypothetical protein
MNTRHVTVPERIVDLRAAATLLADWGFLARPDLPDRAGPALLLVALRDRPSLRHYDPEAIRYWVPVEGRGVSRTVDRHTPLPIAGDFSWGRITLADRLGVTNEYVGFGGHLRAEEVDGISVFVFESPAPILRRGGHSQGWDRGAEHVAAFFGRLLLAVDVVAGFEAALTAASPDAIYAAFLIDVAHRYGRSDLLRRSEPELWSLVDGEALRMQHLRPLAWKAGEELLAAAQRALRPV